jgi:hypothetical protein
VWRREQNSAELSNNSNETARTLRCSSPCFPNVWSLICKNSFSDLALEGLLQKQEEAVVVVAVVSDQECLGQK